MTKVDDSSNRPPGGEAAESSSSRRRRKLSAIMMVDVSGFSRMMGSHEDETVDLIQEFHKRTGRGVVLNTSFNLHGYPIVGTPEDALFVLENSGLRNLALGNYLVRKS